MFDVTRPETLEAVAKWKEEIDTKVQLPNGEPIPCVLFANKVSLFEKDNNFHKYALSDLITPFSWNLSTRLAFQLGSDNM